MENTLGARVITKQHIASKQLGLTLQGTCKILRRITCSSHCEPLFFESQLHHVPAAQVWASYLLFVSLNFVLCKLKKIILSVFIGLL